MSKKYILEVKEEYYGITYFPEPIDNHQLVIYIELLNIELQF